MSSSADPWSRVSTVTVTHHSAAVIESCIRSVSRAAQVIVVDNASDDGTPDLVRRILPTARVTENRVGVGFGNGANIALAQVTSEFALLLGPDSTIDDRSLALLVEAADAWPDAALFGPAIVAPDGSVEPSHDLGLFERMHGPKRVDLDHFPDGPLCADHLSGAVLLIRMASVRPVGFFDPNIFLYYEDDDLCIRVRRAGHALVMVPDARATHINGGSVRPSIHYRWEKFWHMAWSRLYIEAKYKGRAAAMRSAVAVLPKFLGKALGYGLTLNKWKLVRDAARLAGTLAWMSGIRAMPVTEERS